LLLGLRVLSMDTISSESRNPFERSDRIAFPAFTQATWDCPEEDSFGTPRSDISPLKRGSGWTPGTEEPSWLARTEERRGRRDLYFAEREHKGLLTPAGTPSDVMQRGPLFDPDASAFSSRRTSPEEPSPDRGLEPALEEERSATAGAGQGPTPAAHDISKSTRTGSGPSAEISTRETDSLSASSISFGREDTRVRFGDAHAKEAKKAAHAEVIAKMEVAGKVPTPVRGIASACKLPASWCAPPLPPPPPGDTGPPGNVVRQLDFGAAEGRGSPWGQADAKASPAGSLPKSPATDFFDWDSSLSREIPAGLCLTYSPTLVELSPLHSLSSGHSWAHSPWSGASPAVGKAPKKSPETADLSPAQRVRRAQEKAQVKAKHPQGSDVLLETMQQLGSHTPRGGLVLKLRLCRCGCGLHLVPSAASAPASPATPSSPSDHQVRSKTSESKSELKSPCRKAGAGPLPQHLHRDKDDVSASLLADRTTGIASGTGATASRIPRSSLSRSSSAPQLIDERVERDDWLGSVPPDARCKLGSSCGFRSNLHCRSDLWLDDLQSAVGRIRFRYVERYLRGPSKRSRMAEDSIHRGLGSIGGRRSC